MKVAYCKSFQIFSPKIQIFYNHTKFTGKNIILPTTLVVCMLTLDVVDCWFEPCSSQTKDLKIDICCFSAKYAAFRSKRKDKMTRNQDNVSEWGHMCTLGLLFCLAGF
jgi:hypothetical protein